MPSTAVMDDTIDSSSSGDHNAIDSNPPKEPAPLIPLFFETKPPSMSATSSSLLFRLPREIRDEIYDCLWRNSRMYPREGNLSYDFFYGQYSSEWRVCRLPPGILACKLLVSESIHQYYRKAQCLGYNERTVGCASSPYTLLSLYRLKKLVARNLTGAQMGSVRMVLRVGSNPRNSRLVGSRSHASEGKVFAVPEGTNSPASQPAFLLLCDHLSRHNHKIEDLTVRFSVPENWQAFAVVGVKEWILDVSNLQQFGGSFERVEFIINAPRLDLFYFNRTKSKVSRLVLLYRMLQVALEDLGKSLVGANASIFNVRWNARDWVENGQGPRNWHIEITKTPERQPAMRDVSLNGWKGVEAWGRVSCDMRMDESGLGKMKFWCDGTGALVEIGVPGDQEILSRGAGVCSFVDDGTLD